jgi:hypothetical protein
MGCELAGIIPHAFTAASKAKIYLMTLSFLPTRAIVKIKSALSPGLRWALQNSMLPVEQVKQFENGLTQARSVTSVIYKRESGGA